MKTPDFAIEQRIHEIHKELRQHIAHKVNNELQSIQSAVELNRPEDAQANIRDMVIEVRRMLGL